MAELSGRKPIIIMKPLWYRNDQTAIFTEVKLKGWSRSSVGRAVAFDTGGTGSNIACGLSIDILPWAEY